MYEHAAMFLLRYQHGEGEGSNPPAIELCVEGDDYNKEGYLIGQTPPSHLVILVLHAALIMRKRPQAEHRNSFPPVLKKRSR